jgi:hypothetical protein
MTTTLSSILGVLMKTGFLLVILNEVRGIILAAPVIYGLWLSGGTLMAWYLAFCSLAGILLSVLLPIYAANTAKRWVGGRLRTR